MTDPATKQKYTCRQDFKHAISSREALDICPKWMRACDGHDVNLPLRIMSYVKVPADAELGVVWHKTNLTKGGYRNVIKHGMADAIGSSEMGSGKTRTNGRGVLRERVLPFIAQTPAASCASTPRTVSKTKRNADRMKRHTGSQSIGEHRKRIRRKSCSTTRQTTR